MLLFKKEKEVIELILKHLDLVEDCMKAATQAIEYYLAENTGEAKKFARLAEASSSIVMFAM